MNKFEKFLSKKVSIRVLILVVLLNLIFAIQLANLATRSKSVNELVKIPQNLKKIILGSDQDLMVPDKFNKKQNFTIKDNFFFENYLLISRYDGDKKTSVVELIDIQNKKVVHKWEPKINEIIKLSNLDRKIFNLERDNNQKRSIIRHPLLLKDGGLIFSGNEFPLTKIDVCSKTKWISDFPYHHSIEVDHEGNFWSISTNHPKIVTNGVDEKSGINENFFRDDSIIQVSNSGEVLFKKSVMQIFMENELSHLIFPGEINTSYDPLHINDVQPVLKDGKFFQKGDIFLSLRHNSTILLYRPQNNKILWLKKNPWVYQHDIDIIDEEKISIFDNKSLIYYPRYTNQELKPKYNDLLIFDFKTQKVSNEYKNHFVKFDIRTPAQGLSSIYKENVFVEETNFGRVIYFNKKGELLFEYINRAENGNVYTLGWSRLINVKDNKETLKIINDSKCF